MAGDAPGGGAAVAALASLVGPHLDIDLHEAAGLTAALSQRPPASHSHDVVNIGLTPLGQADGLDGVTVLNGAVQGQDGNIVPLKNLKSVTKCFR